MEPEQKSSCNYQNNEGCRCEEYSEPDSDNCYWHDDSQIKDSPDTSKRLEERARTGKPMDGFFLQKANLEGVDLVHRGSSDGYKLTNCDLYRANLSGAHLFNTDLSGSSLMKANLSDSNLNLANLENCNLLGVNLERARIEHMKVGPKLLQQQEAEKISDKNKKRDYHEQCEEIYRILRKTAEHDGLYYERSIYHRKEMAMMRYQMPLYSMQRFGSKVLDILCGYGELPMRIFLIALLQVFFSSFVYFFCGLEIGGEIAGFNPDLSVWTNIGSYFESILYAMITFTTLGYGNIVPIGAALPFSAFQRFIASFTLSLFIITFIKKVTR